MLHRILFRIGTNKRNPSFFKILRKLKETEFVSRQVLDEVKHKNARSYFAFISNNSSYWSEFLSKHDFNIGSPDLISEIKKLPISTKNDLITFNQEMRITGPFRKIFVAETSGTSGQSLEFPRNEYWDSYNRASQMHFYGWYGVKPWFKSIYLWGYDLEFRQTVKIKLFDWLLNRVRLFSYTDEEFEQLGRKLDRFKFIEGYSSMIYGIAKKAGADGRALNNFMMIKGTSEVIHESYQETVKKVFGRKMISEYGAAETGIISFECPEGNMHLLEENLVVEIDGDGALLVTNINSQSFPIIRYRLGDHVELSEDLCACGRNHRLIKEIQGRIGQNIFGFKDKYPSLIIYYIFKNIAQKHGILLIYQANQSKKGELTLEIEKQTEDINRSSLKNISSEVENYFKDDLLVRVEYVDNLKKGQGKAKYFTSTVQV